MFDFVVGGGLLVGTVVYFDCFYSSSPLRRRRFRRFLLFYVSRIYLQFSIRSVRRERRKIKLQVSAENKVSDQIA